MFPSKSNTSKYSLGDYVTIPMVIFLVTMATPISSHVKEKNSIFKARDEDMIFSRRKNPGFSLVVYIIKGYN